MNIIIQSLLTVHSCPWFAASFGQCCTIFCAMGIVDRVPSRPSLLLLLSISTSILLSLHDVIDNLLLLYPPKNQEIQLIALASITIVAFSLIICLGFPDRRYEVDIPRPAFQGYAGNTQGRIDILRVSGVILEHPTGRRSQLVHRHHLFADHHACAVCRYWTRLDTTYERIFREGHLGWDYIQHENIPLTNRERLCSYRMVVAVWCILLVLFILRHSIHFLTFKSQLTTFLVTGDGFVMNALAGGSLICPPWILSILASYPARWFVLPLLYFLLAVLCTILTETMNLVVIPCLRYLGCTAIIVCDRAMAFARWAEGRGELSNTYLFFAWLRGFITGSNTDNT